MSTLKAMSIELSEEVAQLYEKWELESSVRKWSIQDFLGTRKKRETLLRKSI